MRKRTTMRRWPRSRQMTRWRRRPGISSRELRLAGEGCASDQIAVTPEDGTGSHRIFYPPTSQPKGRATDPPLDQLHQGRNTRTTLEILRNSDMNKLFATLAVAVLCRRLGGARWRSRYRLQVHRTRPQDRRRCTRRPERQWHHLLRLTCRVVRMIDKKRNALVYLTYSDRLIEGSPQNSVTAIAVDRSIPIPMR